MNADASRGKVIGRIVWIATAIDVLAYACKFLPFWHGSAAAETVIVLMDEIGLVVSVLILISVPFVARGWKLPVFVIGMLALCFLWFSSVAWWVMVK
ncbi:MAG: hypothetical protein ABSC48_00725 [Terracidiphilus sp.]|jgi:hypothetical protein